MQQREQEQFEQYEITETHLKQFAQYCDNVVDQVEYYNGLESEAERKHQEKFVTSALTTVQTAVVIMSRCPDENMHQRIKDVQQAEKTKVVEAQGQIQNDKAKSWLDSTIGLLENNQEAIEAIYYMQTGKKGPISQELLQATMNGVHDAKARELLEMKPANHRTQYDPAIHGTEAEEEKEDESPAPATDAQPSEQPAAAGDQTHEDVAVDENATHEKPAAEEG